MSMSKAKDLFWIKGGSHNLKLNAQRDPRLDLVLKKKMLQRPLFGLLVKLQYSW